VTVAEFLSRFATAKPTGSQWLVKCPAHDDHTASLAVREGSDGRLLLHWTLATLERLFTATPDGNAFEIEFNTRYGPTSTAATVRIIGPSARCRSRRFR
jgi:hypothetical protein